MKITNVYNLPEQIVRLCDTERHNEPGTLSITTLLQGMKQIILAERHHDEIEEDVSDNIWKIFGTATHAILENETATSVSEERFSAMVDGVKITGKPDDYDLASEIVTDWKTASVWKILVGDFDDWKKQGTGYAWVLHENGFNVKEARFYAILKDHKKSEAKKRSDYPLHAICQQTFPITSADIFAFGNFVREKVAQYKAASVLPDDEIEPCSMEERWAKPTVYAVMKEGRKSSVKNYEGEGNREAAEKHATEIGGYVEVREGVNTKCEDYCNCNKFCSFYKSIHEGEQD